MTNSTSESGALSPEELANRLPLDKTFGAYLLGTFLGLILYGIMVHQTFRHYRLFHSDVPFIRSLVAVVVTLETLHTSLSTYLCYFVLITYYGQLGTALGSGGPWALNIQPALNSVMILSSELFFARRVYEMGSRFRVAAISAMLILVVELGFAILTTYQAFATISTLSTSDSGWIISISVGLPFFADLILTATLMVVLRRSRSGLKQRVEPCSRLSFLVPHTSTSNTFIDRAIIYVVNTGLLHCIFNAFAFVFTIGDYNRSTLLFLFFTTISTRLYANSLLSVLNSRDALANHGLEVVNDGSLTDLNLIARANRRAAAETWNVPQTPEPEPAKINIQITTEREDWEKVRNV